MRRCPPWSAFAFVLLIPLALSKPARACSICGCDPAASTLGLDRPGARALRLGFEDRTLWKETGAGDTRETERENRLLLRAQLAPTAPLAFGVEVPVFLWKQNVHPGGDEHSTRGLGDVMLTARAEVLRTGGLTPRHVVALLGNLKLPTGSNHPHGTEQVDEHGLLGTGSWDGVGGASYTFGDAPWVWYANALGRLNGSNERGFRYGNAFFATAGGRRMLLGDKLQLSLEAQWRAAGKDRFGDGAFDPDSGGHVLYATGGAALGIGQNLLLRVQLQVPAYTSLNGIQSEHPVIYAGLAYDWLL